MFFLFVALNISLSVCLSSMYAFEHMRQAGAFLTTYESIVLQLTQDAGHPKFKQIQPFIKTSAADTGLLTLNNIPSATS